MTHKTCKLCGKSKPVAMFKKMPVHRHKDGRITRCKPCLAAEDRDKRRRYKEKKLARGTGNLIKRKVRFVMEPSDYGLQGCDCGNENTQWSEFESHLWCDKCRKDFLPSHMGVFGGPILMQTSALLGISFDMIHLDGSGVDRYDFEKREFVFHPTDAAISAKPAEKGAAE